MIKFFRKKPILLAVVTLAVIITAWFITRRGKTDAATMPMISVQKGDMQINVLQGGEIRALQNYEVKSEIELPTKILSLIPEGYRITPDDVKSGKVLIELDSADLKDRITTQEIEFQTTVSTFIDADEQRAIQASDNMSLAREAEQAMRFAFMDFERYMGKVAAQSVLKDRALPHTMDELEAYVGRLDATKPSMTLAVPTGKTPAPAATTTTTDPIAAVENATPAPLAKDPLAETQSPSEARETAVAAGQPESKMDGDMPRVDFLPYLAEDKLGDGEAEQRLRQLSNELLLHKSELALAKQNVEASERLAAKEFITRTTLENDQVNYEKTKLSVQTAETQLDLFKKYEFPKQAELYMSGYQEALHKLQRTQRANRSRMAQAESRYETAKRRYEISLERKEELERQLKATVIKAQVPGLVAYGAHNGTFKNSTDLIEEGAAVRFRQTLLTIPNMSEMGVAINIHESQVKKVRLGQPCRVTVDAEPGKTLEGVVAEMAVLPDSTSSRYTPNLKVYPGVVHIRGTHEWLKPGMNAKVEVIVDHLEDILYVPVQSIEVENDHFFTYVNTGSDLERREVQTGSFNNEFIEIKGGLNLGDQVALAIPKRQNLESNPQPISAPPSAKKDAKAEKPKKNLAAVSP